MLIYCFHSFLPIICICLTCLSQRTTSSTLHRSYSSQFDFSSCHPHTCSILPPSTSFKKWPVNIALKLPQSEWDTFDIILSYEGNSSVLVGVQLALKEQMKELRNALIVVNKIYNSKIQNIGEHEMHNVDEDFMQYEKLPIILPFDSWISLSVTIYKHDILTFTFQGPKSICSKATTLKIPTAYNIENRNFTLKIKCNDSPNITVDFQCIRSSINQYPSLDYRDPSASVDSTSEILTRRNSRMPSANVIWTATVCLLLVVLLGLVFVLWQRQRRLLRQGRYARQHKILKKQHEMQQHLSDHQLCESQSAPESSGDQLGRSQHCISVEHFKPVHLNRRHASLELNSNFHIRKTGPKPRTFIRLERFYSQEDRRKSSISSDASAELFGGCSTNGKSNVNTIKPLECHRFTIRNLDQENEFDSTQEDGGITGPYWFHSTRKPDDYPSSHSK